MREEEFRSFLERSETITSKVKAVNSRISRANTAEKILNLSLDFVVADDNRMYRALNEIRENPLEQNGKIQNAVRWYYVFVNGKKFPSLSSYSYLKNI